MNIMNLDWWFFVQLANFLIILVVLNAVLIAPVRRMLKVRAEAIAAQTSEIDGFTTSADGKIKNYQAALEQARRDASVVRADLRADGQAKEKAILESAGNDAAETLKLARHKISAESKAASDTMLAGVAGMAERAASKILGTSL